jgi:hypothetical protein
MTLSRTAQLDQQLNEIERELGMRRRNYPKWVFNGQMKQEQADRQIRLMEGIKETVRQARVDSMMRGMSGQRLDEQAAAAPRRQATVDGVGGLMAAAVCDAMYKRAAETDKTAADKLRPAMLAILEAGQKVAAGDLSRGD